MRADDPATMLRMHEWLRVVEVEAGVEPEVLEAVEKSLLELIATVAHGPSRPGAPLTAFLVGVATGRGQDADELIARVGQLAARADDQTQTT